MSEEIFIAGKNVKGRGTGSLPTNRFEQVRIDFIDEEAQNIKTEVYKDNSKTIIARNDSPDVGFDASFNPYRGCEHGCIYCYARPTHEYLGLSSGLDFETKIFAKMDAAKLLHDELCKKNYQPQVLGMSGVTDCYQPVERSLKLSQQCLLLLVSFRNPVVIITKNFLVTRDIALLEELAAFNAVHVIISITTLDNELARNMEPRACSPERRLLAIELLHKKNIPVSVNMAPIIPGLTDHEIPTVLQEAKLRGARSASYTLLRLPFAVKDLFCDWLERFYPNKKNKVLNRLLEMRKNKLYDAGFHSRMTGEGPYAKHLANMFSRYRTLNNLTNFGTLSTDSFQKPTQTRQLSLF